MLETRRYLVGAAGGEQVSPPGRTAQELLGDDRSPTSRARSEVIETFARVAVYLSGASGSGDAD